jgi:hypothetical protein
MVEPMTFEEFIAFVRLDWDMMTRMDDGEKWSFPTGESYQIDHKEKVLVHGDDGPFTALHASFVWCAGRMGYDLTTASVYAKFLEKGEWPD